MHPDHTVHIPPRPKTDHEWPDSPAMPPQPVPMPPPPPASPREENWALGAPISDEPVPVVRVLSIRGVEYVMMTIALWFSSASLAWVLLNVLNGSANFDFLVVPISALITTIPVFAVLFIRLKRAEIANSNLRLDASKRRCSQLTQILAFLVLLINGSVFVYNVLQKVNDNSEVSIGKSLINLVVVLVIAGGILAYYWFDEHRAKRIQ